MRTLHPVRLPTLASALCLVVSLLAIRTAHAAVPQQLDLRGALLTAGGGPVVDGKYGMKIAIYPDDKGPALWTETLLGVQVKNGSFSVVLGQTQAITAKLLAGASAPHFGVALDSDPELPRVPLRATAQALLADRALGLECSGCVGAEHLAKGSVGGAALATGSVAPSHVGFTWAGSKTKGGAADQALDLACTGCVALSEIAFDGDIDLGGNSLKAKQILATNVAAATVSASTFVGDGSKLTGVQSVVGECKNKGEVVKGIQADGKLVCVAAMDASALPADGLDEVSNGLLTNQFVDTTASGSTPVKIPDNNPIGVSDSLIFPDVGVAQKLTVSAVIETSALDQLSLTLFDPDNAPYVLFDKGGKGTKLEASWPAPNLPVKGDLTTWVGKNPKGKWTLKAVDSAFLNNGTDGAILSWSVSIGTLSTKKVAANGVFHAKGGLQFQVASQHPVTCDASRFGFAYANDKDKALYICNGKDFYPVVLTPVGTQDNPGKGCADILKKMPASKTGLYWVQAGGAARKVWCEMEANDGGWTLAARMVKGSWCHIDAASVGTLTAPTQSACAKLSDAEIRALYTDQFWLSCGTADPHRFGKIDNIANFATDVAEGNKKMTWAMTYGGKTYSGTDHVCCNLGDHNYNTPHIIYSIAKGYNGGKYTADWSGCYNSQGGWHQAGFLYVR